MEVDIILPVADNDQTIDIGDERWKEREMKKWEYNIIGAKQTEENRT